MNLVFADAEKNLGIAIEGLYEKFSKYSTWSKLPGCSCCTDPALAEPMKGKQLRVLTHEDLAKYAFDALFTWGDVEDFKHFLPRIFELCTTASSMSRFCDVEVIFGKLTLAEFDDWPAKERDAVNKFVNSWFCYTLSAYPTPVSTAEVIVCAGRYQADLLPFLEAWRFANTPEALRQFACSWYKLDKNAFLSKDHIAVCGQFLNDPRTIDWLIAGYNQYASEPWADEIAAEIDEFSLTRLL